MFDSLKKKFSSWLGKEEKIKEKPKKKEKKIKEKSSKATKKEEIRKSAKIKKKKTAQEITEEREVTEKVMTDMKQEGLDTTSLDIKVQEAVEELEKEEKTDAKIEEENIELESEQEKIKEKEEKKNKFKLWPFGKKKKEKEISEDKTQIDISDNKPTEKEDNFFSKLARKLSTSALKESDFEEIFLELELTLLENNTALETVDKIKQSLKISLVDKEVKKSDIVKTIISGLKNSILSVLIEPPNFIEQIKKSEKKEPFTILFFGINGSGKTTSIAKIAYLLKKNNISCVLAAADTFRAASIEQLETHAESINVPIIKSNYGSDPASVAFEAKKYAKQHNIKVVLIDTAGRMYTKANLMKEMEKIVRISQPDLKLFVGESITGNDATEQAKTFAETAGIDGIILSKADIDEKAGTILSVSSVTGKPIYFLGTGQAYKDLMIFSKKEVLKNLGLE